MRIGLGSATAAAALAFALAATPAAAHEGHCIEPPEADLEGSGLRVKPLAFFSGPTHVAAAPGDRTRTFVVERVGRVRILRGGKVLDPPFLDLADEIWPTLRTTPDFDNERGMWSIAFPPNYQRSRLFYVFHSGRNGVGRVEEFRRAKRNPDRAVRTSRRVVLRQPRDGNGVHFGGQIAFGPDGRLYASLGDALRHDAVQGQGPYGKLVRLQRRKRNAYKVVARGLRNPYRFSFDAATGDIAIGDVGQDRYEEINFVRSGHRGVVNFGWPIFEGPAPFWGGALPGHQPPALALAHADGWNAVTGGHVVRDRRLPGLDGRYVYGDFCEGEVHSAVIGRRGRARDPRPLGITIPRLSSFGHDGRGRTMVASLSGWVGRLEVDPGR
jgi:glucose/arabinose dehydrogenase